MMTFYHRGTTQNDDRCIGSIRTFDPITRTGLIALFIDQPEAAVCQPSCEPWLPIAENRAAQIFAHVEVKSLNALSRHMCDRSGAHLRLEESDFDHECLNGADLNKQVETRLFCASEDYVLINIVKELAMCRTAHWDSVHPGIEHQQSRKHDYSDLDRPVAYEEGQSHGRSRY